MICQSAKCWSARTPTSRRPAVAEPAPEAGAHARPGSRSRRRWRRRSSRRRSTGPLTSSASGDEKPSPRLQYQCSRRVRPAVLPLEPAAEDQGVDACESISSGERQPHEFVGPLVVAGDRVDGEPEAASGRSSGSGRRRRCRQVVRRLAAGVEDHGARPQLPARLGGLGAARPAAADAASRDEQARRGRKGGASVVMVVPSRGGSVAPGRDRKRGRRGGILRAASRRSAKDSAAAGPLTPEAGAPTRLVPARADEPGADRAEYIDGVEPVTDDRELARRMLARGRAGVRGVLRRPLPRPLPLRARPPGPGRGRRRGGRPGGPLQGDLEARHLPRRGHSVHLAVHLLPSRDLRLLQAQPPGPAPGRPDRGPAGGARGARVAARVAASRAPPRRSTGRSSGASCRSRSTACRAHYGDALEWKYLEGLAVREIADRLGLTAKAAESLLARAREAFRDGFSALVQGAVALPSPPGNPESPS